MRANSLLLIGMVCAGLAGCGGGDVELNVETTDNSVNNGGGGDTGGNNPCASYTISGTNTVRRGTFDGTNCTYNAAFVGVNNPLTVDLTIPFISGVHIFQDSLFVGENVSTGAAPQAGNDPGAVGAGHVLTIEAGNKLAFSDAADYLRINRGSKIIANGSPTAPITLTGFTDAVTGTAGPEDVQLWGGLVLNGNGITNNCTDAERAANQCHVVSEGQPSNYGGNNNAESSGSLRYVIVKHAGFEVATDDELNGITFNAVGSGTVVENVQVYAAYDDGMEFFGGAVNVTNAVMMYVRDDSLDFSDGYVGTIDNVLIIQAANDGNSCIELDNIGSSRSDLGQPFDTAPITAPTVRNMTCVVSRRQGGTHGNSQGIIVRQGGRLLLEDSILDTRYAVAVLGRASATDTPCYRIQSSTGLTDGVAGLSQVDSTIISCPNPAPGAFANGDTFLSWLAGANPSVSGADYSFNTGNTVITDPANGNVSLLATVSSARTFFTATTLTDAAAVAIPALAGGRFYGAVLAANDWTSPWAYGIRASNRGQALWFE
jgi:hypothetical protein